MTARELATFTLYVSKLTHNTHALEIEIEILTFPISSSSNLHHLPLFNDVGSPQEVAMLENGVFL